MHTFEEIPKEQKETDAHKKADMIQEKPVKDRTVSYGNAGCSGACYPAFSDRSAYYAQSSVLASNIVQRKIQVTLAQGEHVPKINVNKDRFSFSKPVHDLYGGESVAHVISHGTIQNGIKEILTSAVAGNEHEPHPEKAEEFYIYNDHNVKADMQRLIKAVIPSAGYQFDIHERLNLGTQIQAQQDEAKEINKTIFETSPTDAGALQEKSNNLLSVLNSSYANLRRGNQDMNNKISSNLDPIAAAEFKQMFDAKKRGTIDGIADSSYQVPQNAGEAQIGVHLEDAAMNELSLAKRMHKLGRLRDRYPALEVLGMFDVKADEASRPDFFTSEMPADSLYEPNIPRSSHTHVAHIKTKAPEKWEYDFPPKKGETWHAGKQSAKLHSHIGAAVKGAGTLGVLAGLAAIPFLGAAGILGGAALGGILFGGASYFTHKAENKQLADEQRKAEIIKFNASKAQMDQIEPDVKKLGLENISDYKDMAAKYEAYQDAYTRFGNSPGRNISKLGKAYQEFHRSRLPVMTKIEEAERFAAARGQKANMDSKDDAYKKGRIRKYNLMCKHYKAYEDAYRTFIDNELDNGNLQKLHSKYHNFRDSAKKFCKELGKQLMK